MTDYDNEEILVQEQSEDIVLSGVVFTKGLETNSPYYVITYDDQLESDYENYVDEARKAEKARQSLQGLYKNLAIIEEE